MALSITSTSALHRRFFAPISALLSKLTRQRACPKLSDGYWLQVGICRVLEGAKNGRDFLQTMQAKMALPSHHHFFATLKSKRRLALCAQANAELVALVAKSLPDAFAAYRALDLFDLHAADGHAHAAAVHDAPQHSNTSPTGKAKFATSHIYSLNLRTHGLTHLALADQITRRKEHEMRTLKRLTLDDLRQGALKGRKVLYIYDPACIDYTLWRELKQGGVYFLTRLKSNARMIHCGSMRHNLADPGNAGVLIDEQVGVAGGMLRHVQFQCPQSGEIYDFLTNEMTLPPGLIARTYRMRWDIEKVYDEVKNKFNEQKAWASTPTAKAMQAQFICLAHNLMVLQEHQLKTQEGVTNTSEIKRKAQRLELEIARLAQKKEVLPVLLQDFQRLTQRSVKYVRWLRAFLFVDAPWPTVVAALRKSYAVS
jgi:hypothetical protein